VTRRVREIKQTKLREGERGGGGRGKNTHITHNKECAILREKRREERDKCLFVV